MESASGSRDGRYPAQFPISWEMTEGREGEVKVLGMRACGKEGTNLGMKLQGQGNCSYITNETGVRPI